MLLIFGPSTFYFWQRLSLSHPTFFTLLNLSKRFSFERLRWLHFSCSLSGSFFLHSCSLCIWIVFSSIDPLVFPFVSWFLSFRWLWRESPCLILPTLTLLPFLCVMFSWHAVQLLCSPSHLFSFDVTCIVKLVVTWIRKGILYYHHELNRRAEVTTSFGIT